jgi:hypothetical protein
MTNLIANLVPLPPLPKLPDKVQSTINHAKTFLNDPLCPHDEKIRIRQDITVLCEYIKKKYTHEHKQRGDRIRRLKPIDIISHLTSSSLLSNKKIIKPKRTKKPTRKHTRKKQSLKPQQKHNRVPKNKKKIKQKKKQNQVQTNADKYQSESSSPSGSESDCLTNSDGSESD